MHSSRMRTAHFSWHVGEGCLPGGGVCPGVDSEWLSTRTEFPARVRVSGHLGTLIQSVGHLLIKVRQGGCYVCRGGVCLGDGGVWPVGCLSGGCFAWVVYTLAPWTEWLTGVKTLPCPKLRLRAVIIYRLFNSSLWRHISRTYTTFTNTICYTQIWHWKHFVGF